MTHRILIVANQTLGSEDLAAMVRERVRASATELWVVVPATHPRDQASVPVAGDGAAAARRGTGEDADAYALAQRRLQAAHDRFAELGVVVGGEVGDEDPFTAVSDVLSHRTFDEVIVSTLPSAASRWLRTDLPSRVRRAFDVPVTTVMGRVAPRG